MRGSNGLALALLALLAACGGREEARNSDFKVEDQGGFENRGDADEPNAAVAAEAPRGWRVRSETAGPAAVYIDAARGPAFALRCDRARKQIAIQLGGSAAGSRAAIQIVTSTRGAQRYEGQVIGGANPRVQARTALDDPFLENMAAPGEQLAVSAGDGSEGLIVPGGSPIRRVLEGCRAPAAVQGPSYTGTAPNGVLVSLTLGSGDPPRFRLAEQAGEPPRTILGSYSRLTGERGPILQLVPDDGGATIFLEQIAPDTLVYRTPANEPDPALDASPLRLMRPSAITPPREPTAAEER